ncbi:MAG: ankyrin repeat domain-containing protein [Bacteroidales bacterium]|nr:ankyrin repeat domain-containing protein [Bacteroidales bacterium]
MNQFVNEALFAAVASGDPVKVEEALKEEKINPTTYYGAKSIVFAAKKESSQILKMLLENGQKIDRELFWRRTAQPALSNAVRAGNEESVNLLLQYGAVAHKKSVTIHNNTNQNRSKTKFCLEDGIFVPEKSSRDNLFIQSAGEGKLKKVKELLEEEVSEKAFLTAIDVALEKNRWEIATFLTEYSDNREVETYTECIKKMFLKSSYIGDTEKVKFYLEKLIENVVGTLTDETGKTTLEIALENNPTDIIKILSNYGFHESSLQYAYKCLLSAKS